MAFPFQALRFLFTIRLTKCFRNFSHLTNPVRGIYAEVERMFQTICKKNLPFRLYTGKVEVGREYDTIKR